MGERETEREGLRVREAVNLCVLLACASAKSHAQRVGALAAFASRATVCVAFVQWAKFLERARGMVCAMAGTACGAPAGHLSYASCCAIDSWPASPPRTGMPRAQEGVARPGSRHSACSRNCPLRTKWVRFLPLSCARKVVGKLAAAGR